MAGVLNSYLFGSAVTAMAFRSASSDGATLRVSKPTGAAVGDMVCVWVNYGPNNLTMTTTGGGSAWNVTRVTWAAHGYTSTFFWKVINATDLDPTKFWDMSAAAYETINTLCYQGNGATTATVKATAANNVNQSTLTLTGYTKNAGHRGTAVFFADRDENLDGNNGSNYTRPSGFTMRFDADYANFWCMGGDKLTGYADGANVVWSGVNGSNGFAEVGILVEFT
mgnify:CR=1 FL=1